MCFACSIQSLAKAARVNAVGACSLSWHCVNGGAMHLVLAGLEKANAMLVRYIETDIRQNR